MDRDELILQKLSELAEDVKDLRKNVGGLQKDITDVKLQQADDRRRSETADVKLAGDLQRLESKIDAGLDRVESKLTADSQRVESKIDSVVTKISERKTDTNERWKIGGIIVSTAIAILALIKSFFFS
jgi:phage shock protein A